MNTDWLCFRKRGGVALVDPDEPRLVPEVTPLPSGRLTARWRDVVSGEVSAVGVAPQGPQDTN